MFHGMGLTVQTPVNQVFQGVARYISPDQQFVQLFEDANKVYSKFPGFSKLLRARFSHVAGRSSWQDAHAWLMGFRSKFLFLPVFPLSVASHDEQVRDAARAMSMKCEGAFRREISSLRLAGISPEKRYKRALDILAVIVDESQVSNPIKVENPSEKQIIGALMRLQTEKWWRKQLRKLRAQYLENACRHLGMVCKRKSSYCSENTLRRRLSQKKQNRQLLESMFAENDLGQVYTLAELSDLGVSNPVNRRHDMMNRISGFEKLAEQDQDIEWQPVFCTLTCPSRFHSHGRNGFQNKKWSGETPKDAQAHLCKVWSLTRSMWDRLDINTFGFRVAEPHHDGCPHWHLLLWVPAGQVKQAMDVFHSYALQMDGNEAGAIERRFTWEEIDEEKGSPTGYVAKYVSKNIDGLDANGDAWDKKSVVNAAKTEAWASTWDIRQFQQIGGASVTVYRELRRLDVPEYNELVEQIRKAADEGDWAEYTRLMGGPTVQRDAQPLRALHVIKEKINEYGEEIRQMWGLFAVFAGVEIKTRLREWGIYSSRGIPEYAAPAALGGAGETGPPLDLCQ